MQDHLQKSAGRERRSSPAIRTRGRLGKRADAGLCAETPPAHGLPLPGVALKD